MEKAVITREHSMKIEPRLAQESLIPVHTQPLRAGAQGIGNMTHEGAFTFTINE
jgi:hypothetical protein